jgi:hypothetical protein
MVGGREGLEGKNRHCDVSVLVEYFIQGPNPNPQFSNLTKLPN